MKLSKKQPYKTGRNCGMPFSAPTSHHNARHQILWAARIVVQSASCLGALIVFLIQFVRNVYRSDTNILIYTFLKYSRYIIQLMMMLISIIYQPDKSDNCWGHRMRVLSIDFESLSISKRHTSDTQRRSFDCYHN